MKRPSISRKDIKLATALISPDAGKVLAKYRTNSRGMQTYFREDKPIETVTVQVATFPCFSSCDRVFKSVTLPRVKFLEGAE